MFINMNHFMMQPAPRYHCDYNYGCTPQANQNKYASKYALLAKFLSLSVCCTVPLLLLMYLHGWLVNSGPIAS